MATRHDLQSWILEALEANGPSTVVEVATYIWETYEAEIRATGDFFYIWQYDMRWQAQKLQDERKLVKRKSDRKWAIA